MSIFIVRGNKRENEGKDKREDRNVLSIGNKEN